MLKNLGSRILDVKPYDTKDRTGYIVTYNEGDQCYSEPGRRYQSNVNYECDPDGNSSLNDFPQLVHTGTAKPYFGIGQCIFDFVWRSKFACPVCRLDQVDVHQQFCGADNTASVHAKRKPGEQCTIDFMPEAFNEKHFHEDPYMGIYSHNFNVYVGKEHFKRKCNVLKDAVSHPFLQVILDILAVTFTVLLLCLIFTCQKYRNVSSMYDQLRQSDSASAGRVIDRNGRVVRDEDRPARRRGAQDADSSKRASDGAKEAERKADNEIDIGDLDVDFA